MDKWVPQKKTKAKQNNKQVKWIDGETERNGERRENFFKNYFLFSFLSQIYENLTVGIRRDKHEKCSTIRGLLVSTKNTRFHREFR